MEPLHFARLDQPPHATPLLNTAVIGIVLKNMEENFYVSFGTLTSRHQKNLSLRFIE